MRGGNPHVRERDHYHLAASARKRQATHNPAFITRVKDVLNLHAAARGISTCCERSIRLTSGVTCAGIGRCASICCNKDATTVASSIIAIASPVLTGLRIRTEAFLYRGVDKLHIRSIEPQPRKVSPN